MPLTRFILTIQARALLSHALLKLTAKSRPHHGEAAAVRLLLPLCRHHNNDSVSAPVLLQHLGYHTYIRTYIHTYCVCVCVSELAEQQQTGTSDGDQHSGF